MTTSQSPRPDQVLFAQGFDHHRNGRLAEAETLYGRVLEANPQHVDALHLLGAIKGQRGEAAEAERLIGTALKLNPNSALIWSNYGNVLKLLNRNDEALASYERALGIAPDHVDALINRGNMLDLLGRGTEALESYDRAVALAPNHPLAHYNRGRKLLADGRHEEALLGLDRALALAPNRPDTLTTRGYALWRLGRSPEALDSYDKALQLAPKHLDATVARARVLADLERHADSLAGADDALAIDPGSVAAHNLRGIALKRLHRLADAGLCFDRALTLAPDDVDALVNRGTVFQQFKRQEKALADYDRALMLAPEHADAHYNRGTLLAEMRRFDDAASSFERVLELAPDHLLALGGLAQAAQYACDWPKMSRLSHVLDARVADGKVIVAPFTYIGYGAIQRLQTRCAERYVRHKLSALQVPPPAASAYKHDRIRVAYLSSDFREHAVAFQIAELLELHDRSRFEILGVSLGLDDRSHTRARITKAFDRFYDASTDPDDDVASLIRKLEVDIAVDLNGHTMDARLAILAKRPAPVQVAYLGFPGSMGASFVDYLLADPFVVPFEEQQYFIEKVVHLPDSYQVNDSKRAVPQVSSTRKAEGLPESGFVFCCFNNSYKIRTAVFDVWMGLLRNIPGSVLWLFRASNAASKNLRREALARGVAPERLVFCERVSPDRHIARQRLGDLYLDTLPYTSHGTGSFALWAGLPMVTCLGQTFAGRVGASLLHAAGLPELVTHSLEEYEALALKLARDPAMLGAIRTKLDRNRTTCPLFDTDRFRRHIEWAYTHMCELSRRGEPPQSFAVPPLD